MKNLCLTCEYVAIGKYEGITFFCERSGRVGEVFIDSCCEHWEKNDLLYTDEEIFDEYI